MKNIGKYIMWFFVAIVIIVDVLLTVYLLNYNQFNVAEFGKKTVLIMDGRLKIEDFKKGDFVLVNKTDSKEIRTGDYIFFYDTNSKDRGVINYGKIKMVTVNTGTDNTYIMDNDYILGYDAVIGKSDDVAVYPVIGGIIGFLSSKWVFLFAIIMPILVLFLFQLYLLIQELKKAKK